MADGQWIQATLTRIEKKIDTNAEGIGRIRVDVARMKWHGWAIKLIFGAVVTGMFALAIAWVQNGGQ